MADQRLKVNFPWGGRPKLWSRNRAAEESGTALQERGPEFTLVIYCTPSTGRDVY